MNQEFFRKLTDIMGEGNVLIDEVMSKHITFRVGGCATYYVEITKEQELCDIMKLLSEYKDISYYVIGNGSNMLIRDEGYEGLIIQLGNKFADINIDGCRVVAKAGALLSKVAKLAYEASLTGMECLQGIPGTIGGAVTMNAGAYGAEIKDVIVSAKVLDKHTGEVMTLTRDELNLSYRHSKVMEEGYIVLSAEFNLAIGDKEAIKDKMDTCANARKEKQPLEYPSAGSTFKRPEGYFAGKLIQDAGLRGYTVGGAQVSEKHCGFIINKGDATAKDILDVINYVAKEVKSQFGVELEPEVRIL